MKKDIKIALIHDFLVQYGGAERVLKVLSDMYPDAPIYTLLYDKEKMENFLDGREIRPSYLQKFPKFLRKKYRLFLPFFPIIPETFDLRDFDLVISSSGAWSKGIVTKLDTTHIAYIHSPMRFIWDYNEKYLKENKKSKLGFLVRMLFNYLRVWDRMAADRPDFLIANSEYTQKRIKKYYRRDSEIIYPPVSLCERFSKNIENKIATIDFPEKDYFLIVSRLSAYKKIDFVIEAFNKLELNLIIIGEGREEKYLKSIANKNIKFLGWQNDDIVYQYYLNATGFIFPTEDDFGITPVESMIAGTPVLAFRCGGVLETVKEGITGEFFDAQTPEVLADCVRRFMLNKEKYNIETIKEWGKNFSKEKFEKEFYAYVDKVL